MARTVCNGASAAGDQIMIFDVTARRRLTSIRVASLASAGQSGTPPSVLYWTWLGDAVTLAVVATSGVFHLQPTDGTRART